MINNDDKIAVLFPGGGSQFVGMGESFCRKYKTASDIYERASDILQIDLKKLCFEENDELDITENAQPALLVTQIAILRVLQEEGLKADYYAGLSGGEYSALVASGALSFEDAVRLVRIRGRLMQNAVPLGTGMMSAIIGLPNATVEEICESISPTLSITNYNCPGQVVIGGYTQDVEKANELLDKAGAVAIRPLKISVMSHCALLKDAASELEKEISKVSFGDIQTPYIANVTAEIIDNKSKINEMLVKQLYSPVKWQQTLELLNKKLHINNYYEICADTSYKFFKYISRKAQVKVIKEAEDIIADT